MEQHLGHQTYSDNLRSMVEDRDDVVVSWVPVEYEKTDRWWERLPAESARAALRGRAEVDDGLRGLDADVCVFNTQVPAVLAGRRARARPYVLCSDVTPRQYDAMAAGYQHRADRAGPLRWLKHRWNLSVFERAAAHAPWSSWVRHSLISEYGIRPEAIEVIPPGVDTASWQPAEHGGTGPMQVLFVGGDFSRKGGDVLLEAMAHLPGGAAELRAVTRSALDPRAGVEVFPGLNQNDPRLRELFRTSDVFVLPSRSETFGIAAVEAGAAGLPVVVSAVGGLEDLVDDGVTGFAVPPDDANQLALALQRFVDEPALRARMGAAARQRAEREFDARRNADRLVRLALSCLDGGPRRQ